MPTGSAFTSLSVSYLKISTQQDYHFFYEMLTGQLFISHREEVIHDRKPLHYLTP